MVTTRSQRNNKTGTKPPPVKKMSDVKKKRTSTRSKSKTPKKKVSTKSKTIKGQFDKERVSKSRLAVGKFHILKKKLKTRNEICENT